MLGGFITSHVVFPMMVGAAVWLPLLLLTIERLAQRFLRARESGATHGILLASIPDMAVGTLAVGMAFLAGHPEMYYYVGLTAAAYSVWRLAAVVRARGPESNGWRSGLALGAMLVAMALLGIGLGAAQWIPLLELVQVNWRQGARPSRRCRAGPGRSAARWRSLSPISTATPRTTPGSTCSAAKSSR